MEVARNIALIFLSIEAFVMALIPLAIIGGLAYGVYRLNGVVKVYLRKAQIWVQNANDLVQEASTKIAAPFIKMHEIFTMISTMIDSLRRRGI